MTRGIVFGEKYSMDYDAFYSSKDYEEESRRIVELIEKYSPAAHNLLELGCGTGNHAKFLAKHYDLTSVDRSYHMLQIARNKLNDSNVKFVQADITHLPSFQRKFDVAISMFHVINYIRDRKNVINLFRNLGTMLVAEGAVIFDSWNGIAVLTERPQTRVKVVEFGDRKLIRIVEPRLDMRNNICENSYKIIIIEGRKLQDVYEETHKMRYFFPLEIEDILVEAGFDMIQITNDRGRELTDSDWSMQVVAKRQ